MSTAWKTVVLAAALVGVSGAHGAIDTFTDRAAFLAAAGTPDLNEDFSSFAQDVSLGATPTAIAGGGASLAVEGTVVASPNLIDVPPYGFNDTGTTGVGAFAYLYNNAPEGTTPGTSIRLAFVSPVRAFGLESWLGEPLEFTDVDLIGSGGQVIGTLQLGATPAAFSGFVATAGESVHSLLFRSRLLTGGSGGESYGIDNLVGVTIPSPAVWPIALGALIVAGRKRRN